MECDIFAGNYESLSDENIESALLDRRNVDRRNVDRRSSSSCCIFMMDHLLTIIKLIWPIACLITNIILFTKYMFDICYQYQYILLVAISVSNIINIYRTINYRNQCQTSFCCYQLIKIFHFILTWIILIFFVMTAFSNLGNCNQAIVMYYYLYIFVLVNYFLNFIIQIVIMTLLLCRVAILSPRLIIRLVGEFPIKLGLDNDKIDQLPLYQYTGEKLVDLKNNMTIDFECYHDTCCVCLEKYKVNAWVRYLNCKHFFHQECIDQWLRINNSCPVCRSQL
jgi:Ring finger domain